MEQKDPSSPFEEYKVKKMTTSLSTLKFDISILWEMNSTRQEETQYILIVTKDLVS